MRGFLKAFYLFCQNRAALVFPSYFIGLSQACLPLAIWLCNLTSMFEDDLDPRKPKKVLKSLDSYSIDELKEYIGNLKQEISRAELEIVKKEAHKNAASSFFKTK